MKIMNILIVSFCIIMLLSQSVYALNAIFSTGENWEAIGKEHVNMTMDTNELSEISSQLYNLLLAVATAVALIVGAMLGIKFMTAGIDKKVEVKEALFPYLISCVVVFGSLGIWRLVVLIMSEI